jgi:hypothetical protein
MARIFLSYRRSDSKWVAGRLYDRLAEVIGRDNIFFDVSNIEPGEDFVQRISEIVGSCDVLLVVIGPNWLSVQDGSGRRRLDNSRDLVRTEIGAALQRNIRVIPILVDGAVMPEEEQLPKELAPLARRNAHDVSFAHFHTDLDSFIRVLQRILAGPSGKPNIPPQPERPKPEARTAQAVATKLPFTLSLTTLGGIATPLIAKGADLPAEASEVFSTAEDNQKSVEVSLFLGERASTSENVPVGKFLLHGIPLAPRGVPQIKITAIVDTFLILTVTAEDEGTGIKEVLDAVDLTRIHVPPEALKEDAPKAQDFDFNGFDSGPNFSNFFEMLFGTSGKKSDTEAELTLSESEALSGGTRTLKIHNGPEVVVKIPAGIKGGQRIRLRGLGEKAADGKSGDLFLRIRVETTPS